MHARIRLTILSTVVLVFAVWAGWLTWDVQSLRAQIADQVGWQLDLASIRNHPTGEVSQTVLASSLPGLRDRFANEPSVLEALTDLERAQERGDEKLAAQLVEQMVDTVRTSNGAISVSLGQRWDQATLLIFLSLGFAIGVVWQTARRQQDLTVLQTTTATLTATKDRMARVGVGFIGLTLDGDVVFANEVAEGLAATCRSPEDWWRAVTKGAEQPGSIPCAECGEAAPVGRVDVEDHTGLGMRVLEVVFGGHAHDLNEPHHNVVLVRDVTEQRRKQVLTVLEQRVSTVDELATGIAVQVEEPLKGVLRHLSTANETADGESAKAIKKAQFAAVQLRDVIVGFRVMGTTTHSGTTDAAIACRHAAQLVQHRLGRRTELVTRHGEDLTVPVEGAALTQIVFSFLSDSVEACRADRGRHHVLLASSRETGGIVIEVTDDRDPRSAADLVARSVARERVQAMGASLDVTLNAGKHTVRIGFRTTM